MGTDAEDDPTLKRRNETKFTTQRTSETIVDRVVQLALNSDPAITDVRVDDGNPRGAGTVDVIVSSRLVTAPPGAVANAQANIGAAFFGPDGLIDVTAAIERILALVGTIYFTPSFTEAQARAAVEGAVDAFISETPIGGYDFSPGPRNIVSLNDIVAAIEALPQVRKVSLVNPSSDLTIGVNEKLVKSADTYAGLAYVRTRK
jgi:hypothetical protein